MPLNIKKRFSSYVEPSELLFHASKALIGSWLQAFRSADFTALLDFPLLRDRAFGSWYKAIDTHFFDFERDCTPVPQLVGSAYGTVLELGPATGNQITRFDKVRVRQIYGVEPVKSVHAELRRRVEESGWAEHYVQVVGGVEDRDLLEREGIVEGSVDCILSIQVLCSVSNPEVVMKKLYALLKPRGELIFWGHHRSHDLLTQWIQWIWNFVWPLAIGGCQLDRQIKKVLMEAGKWEHEEIGGDEEPWALFPRVWGRFVKASSGDSTM